MNSARLPTAVLGGTATRGARRESRQGARATRQSSTISPDEDRNQADAIRASTGLPQGFHRASTGRPQDFHRRTCSMTPAIKAPVGSLMPSGAKPERRAARCLPERHALGFVSGPRVRQWHSGSSGVTAPVQGALLSVGLGAVCRLHDAVGRQSATGQHAIQTASSGHRRAAPSASAAPSTSAALIIVDQMLGAECPRRLTCQIRN